MRLSTGWILLTSLVLVSGCGSGEDAIRGARNQPNDFSGGTNPADDFSSGSTGDSGSSAGLEANEVRITLELPVELAPEGEATRRNLNRVAPDSISVYRTNPALQNLGTIAVDNHIDSSGTTVLSFAEGLPQGPDVIIEASYGDLRIRAPAADADQDVKINPFSEYLIRNTLPGYSNSEFQRILDCVDNAQDEPCPNQHVWSGLADQVQDFEIDIPTTASLDDAVELLAGRGDFFRYVSDMADYAIPAGTTSDGIRASSADYNAVFMGVELGQSFVESSLQGAGQWGVRTSRTATTTDANGTSTTWPALTLASLDAFGIQMTALASDIPYGRKTLIHAAGNSFFTRGSGYWQTNSHASAPAAATLLADTRLYSGRAMYQSITGQDSARIMGWTRNPWFMDAWVSPRHSETSPVEQVLTGYFSAGKAIELEATGDQFRRKQILEHHYLSALELDLIRASGLDPEDLDGRRYHAMYLAIRFADNTSTPVTIETGLGDWQITGGSIAQTRTSTTLSRAPDGSVNVTESDGITDTWTLSSGQPDSGRLYLDMGSSSDAQITKALGAGTPQGDLLAFSLDDSPMGDGMLIAIPQAATAAPVAGQYRLQGFALGMNPDSNHLRHFDKASLVINSDTTATLYPRTLEVRHSVAEQTLSLPQAVDTAPLQLNYARAGNGRVTFSSDSLLLEGFTSGDGTPFYLLLRNTESDEQQLGLVLATPVP